MTNQTRHTGIEVVRPVTPRCGYRAAMFDFDGTCSLVRSNWQGIMVPMMVEGLLAQRTGEAADQVQRLVEEFVMELTGKPTIHQMLRYCEEIRRRGGAPESPEVYKDQYHERLLRQAGSRIEDLRSGAVPPERWGVPGIHAFLRHLEQQGWHLYLASGTEIPYVRAELVALQLDRFFGPRVYAPEEGQVHFSKAEVFERMQRECGLSAEQIIGFGDGVVETQDVSQGGGLAVGMATDEVHFGALSPFKRERLISAGASLIMADFTAGAALLELLQS